MRHAILSLLSAALIAGPLPAAAAGCYADYKAKQDNPLRLHYGVAQINGACNAGSAQAELSARLAGGFGEDHDNIALPTRANHDIVVTVAGVPKACRNVTCGWISDPCKDNVSK